MKISQETLNLPVVKDIVNKEEISWVNPKWKPFEISDIECGKIVSDADIEDARLRLDRFAPFIKKSFPETTKDNGIIESPIVEIENMKKELTTTYNSNIKGRLLLKCDNDLAIAGSIKARGGIYEVLVHAENLAIKAGKLNVTDNYKILAEPAMQEFFSKYTIQVASTGNLGLSVGIISAQLGFNVKVHMSVDAKGWKKELLRRQGVEVIEYAEDYSKAVVEGRNISNQNPNSYFVDDEKSVNLFLGYAVAASRLKQQFDEMNITIDDEHPLIVSIPAGVGGAPGGVAYGLKRIFKDNVHCFFAEPVLCPSVTLGIATGLHEEANIHKFGDFAMTQADGLACAKPSGFVTRLMTSLLAGSFTVDDAKLFDYLRMLYKNENIAIEPSSCATFIGIVNFYKSQSMKDYAIKHGLTDKKLANAINVAWATGGSLVPMAERKKYLTTYL